MKILDKIKEKLRNHIPNNVKHIYLRFGKMIIELLDVMIQEILFISLMLKYIQLLKVNLFS